MLEDGLITVLEQSARLRKLGIVDEQGKIVGDALPGDMLPGSETDLSSL